MANFDWTLASLTLILTGIGLILIYSAVSPMGEAGKIFITRQILWCLLAMIMSAVFLLFDYSFLEDWAFWLYASIILSLLIVWAVGRVTAGSRRWIEIGFMRFQPSEFAKPIIVVILAKYLSTRENQSSLSLPELVRLMAIVLAPALLVLAQPDLGTAIVILLISVSLILFVGISRNAFVVIGLFAGAAIPLLIYLGDKILLDYQKKRIITFLYPDSDPLGAGYHIVQSQIAIGSGGVFGSGFLQGTQNQLMFLPVKHTDFIFSILAEEWGFLGCLALFVLFGLLFIKSLTIVGKARNEFGALLAFGAISIIFWHVFINTGMVMGLLPVVGVPLSFISYGGSSLMAGYFCVSMVLNVSMRRFHYK